MRSKYPLIIQRLRNLEMTQSELAERMGISPSTLSDKLNGRIKLNEDDMQLIANELLRPDEGLNALFPRRMLCA